MKKLTYLIFKKQIDLVFWFVLGLIDIFRFNSEKNQIILMTYIMLYLFGFCGLIRLIKLQLADNLVENPNWINVRFLILFSFNLALLLNPLNLWEYILLMTLLFLSACISYSTEWGTRYTASILCLVILAYTVSYYGLSFSISKSELFWILCVCGVQVFLVFLNNLVKETIEERQLEIDLTELDKQNFTPSFIETQCRFCQYSHLKSYHGVLFVCGFHPYGKEDCEDFSQSYNKVEE